MKSVTVSLIGVIFFVLSLPRVLGQPIDNLMFGSCLVPARPHPALTVAAEAEPDLFLFLGDNVYADTTNPQEMRAHYLRLSRSEAFQRLTRTARVHAVWDDHDYGRNDAGADFPAREMAEAVFEEFWIGSVPPRESVPGTYGSATLGTGEDGVRIILLDTRYFRSPLRRGRTEPGKGPYVPDDSPEATLLGDAQWQWLEQEMSEPAGLRIIVSSIQVLAEHHGYESWANFPREKRRLLSLIHQAGVEKTLILSGDRHFAEISAATLSPEGDALPLSESQGPYLIDVTSSGINRRYPVDRPTDNMFRIGDYYLEHNVGQLLFSASETESVGSLEIRILDDGGRVVISQEWL